MPSQGNCVLMCPVQETELRQREKLLHPLEILHGTEKYKLPEADPCRVVKCFSRSAAGIDLASPDLLRPFSILVKTVRYLLTFVLRDSRFSSVCKYDFIADRLRAVQQDMIIQSLGPEECVQLLEPMVKFHCLYGYRLINEPIIQYDPILNKKQLLEYLKRLLVCYDEIEQSNLDNCMRKLQINETSNSIDSHFESRCLSEAIYIVCNLGDVHPLERYLKLPEQYKKSYVKTCFEMSICHLTRNWVRELYLIKKIPPLAMCCVALHIPDIRRTTYQVMSLAYNSKVLKYPLENLMQVLLHEDYDYFVKECLHYNLKLIEHKYISFEKESFKFNCTIPLKKLHFLDNLIDNVDLLR